MFAVAHLLALSVAIAATSAALPSATEVEFDYIIVGGGTAGNAVGTRLSQALPASRILVIEAGPAAPDELGINVPAKKGTTLNTRYDWNFTSVPQTSLKGRTISINRGKVLGGSSALNLMCYDRAAVPEYDAWEDLGNDGWNWSSLYAAMKKAGNYTGGPPDSETDGPVHAVVNRIKPAHQWAWFPTLNDSFGIPINEDSISGNPIGVSLQPNSIDPTHYNRSYSANAYLPCADSNLKVLTDTMVANINLANNGDIYHATGVTLANGSVIMANQEVIISAGSIQSPGLLELSGIGQASVLSAASIPQLIDLPGVGENHQDHIRVSAAYQLKSNYTSIDILKINATLASEELSKWIAGALSLYDFSASGFLFTNWPQIVGNDSHLVSLAQSAIGASTHPVDQKKLQYLSNPDVPQVEVIFSDGYTGVKGFPTPGSALYGKTFFTLIGGLMHPISRGSVHINASEPRGKPLIDPHYVSTEYEVQALVEIAKFIRAQAMTPPLRDVWEAEYEPSMDVVKTDADWRQYVLNTTLSIFHPTSTCAMLPRAQGGVVDDRLVVYGTDNLRIADASVFPVQVSAHIQTAVYGVAERAAEIIAAVAREKDSKSGS